MFIILARLVRPDTGKAILTKLIKYRVVNSARARVTLLRKGRVVNKKYVRRGKNKLIKITKSLKSNLSLLVTSP